MTRARRVAATAAALLLTAVLAAGCGSSDKAGAAGSASSTTSPGSSGPGTSASSTTAASTTTAAPTTSATDTGTAPSDGSDGTAPVAQDADQPQTDTLPDPDDPLFQARMKALWSAIVTDDPQQAMGAFFPLGAYEQVKAISDPDSDYQNRLIAAYEQDIHDLHSQLGSDPTYKGVDVPTGKAQWIQPGVEANKGSYWRVYGTQMDYSSGGQDASFPLTSLISWRGQWYVVHLGAIR